MSIIKHYDIKVNKTNRKFSSISFTNSNKNIDDKINKRIKFMKMCIDEIAYDLVYEQREIIIKKMKIAENRFKKSTNIFDTSIHDRMVFINNDLFKVECKDIIFDREYKKHYFIDNENNKILLDNTNSIGIVDLIKGPKNNEEWFIKYKMKSLPKKLQDLFQEESILDRLYENYKNSKSDSDEKSDMLTIEKWNEEITNSKEKDKLIKKYITDNGSLSELKNMPKIYYHYNHNWGSKRNNRNNRNEIIGEKFDRSRKKFILELDWSGISDKEHAGVSADRSYDLNQLKKNIKIDYKRNWGLKKN